MPSLKTYRNRIKSVKSTQKITKAMKMVAAAKLKRAKDNAEAARPYAEAMAAMLASLAASAAGNDNAPKLLIGHKTRDKHLLIVATSDRGLCGGFNSTIARAVKRKTREWMGEGKQPQLFFIGRKGYDQLQLEFGSLSAGKITDLSKHKIVYGDAEDIAKKVILMFEAGEVDMVSIVYNKFKSAISQEVTFQQLIPLIPGAGRDQPDSGFDAYASTQDEETGRPRPAPGINAPHDYEPEEEEILKDLLPKNIGVQIYRALLENAASEQGARMTAMDNATRNAGDMIKKLTLQYNRSRQAAITKELIEIISGAEAV